MFENLTDRLSRTLRNISGRGRLDRKYQKPCVKCVWHYEADVALPVVRDVARRKGAVGRKRSAPGCKRRGRVRQDRQG